MSFLDGLNLISDKKMISCQHHIIQSINELNELKAFLLSNVLLLSVDKKIKRKKEM